jgi:hypothetical protein
MTKPIPEGAKWIRLTYEHHVKVHRMYLQWVQSLEKTLADLRRMYEEEYPDLPPIGGKLK